MWFSPGKTELFRGTKKKGEGTLHKTEIEGRNGPKNGGWKPVGLAMKERKSSQKKEKSSGAGILFITRRKRKE